MKSLIRSRSIFAMLFCLVAGTASIGLAAGDSWRADWPVLKTYDRDHVERIALPLGGIGTGTVSLGGRGNLMDWEIMNRPAKGYIPYGGQQTGPFFALHVGSVDGPFTRVIEGPLPLSAYEASHGSTAVNHGLPRFRDVSFAAAYPLGQVLLSDPDSPVDVRIEAWNPLVPGDAEASGIPVAALRFVVINKTGRPLKAAVCGTLPNFIGADGSGTARDWKNDPITTGPKKNVNEFRATGAAARPVHDLGRRRSQARGLGHDGPGRRGRDAGHEPDVVDRRRVGDVAPRFLGRFRGRRGPRSPALRRARTCPSARSPSRSTCRRAAAPKPRSSSPGTSPTASPGRPRARRTTSSATTTRRAGPTPGRRPRISPGAARASRRGPSSSSAPSREALSRPRSRRPPSSTSARSGRRPASGRPTASSSASRVRATIPAAAGARAPTSGTTSRPRRSSSAPWPGPCARPSFSPRPTIRA